MSFPETPIPACSSFGCTDLRVPVPGRAREGNANVVANDVVWNTIARNWLESTRFNRVAARQRSGNPINPYLAPLVRNLAHQLTIPVDMWRLH